MENIAVLKNQNFGIFFTKSKFYYKNKIYYSIILLELYILYKKITIWTDFIKKYKNTRLIHKIEFKMM